MKDPDPAVGDEDEDVTAEEEHVDQAVLDVCENGAGLDG
jgi:hypothetical protein